MNITWAQERTLLSIGPDAALYDGVEQDLLSEVIEDLGNTGGVREWYPTDEDRGLVQGTTADVTHKVHMLLVR